MLEKNSRVLLTKEDLSFYNRGEVSPRLLESWNMDFSTLREIVESQNFELVNSNDES